MIIPNIKNIVSRNSKIRIFELDRIEELGKQPQSSIVPFSDFMLIEIMKTTTKEVSITAENRTPSPIIKQIPKINSTQGNNNATPVIINVGRI